VPNVRAPPARAKASRVKEQRKFWMRWRVRLGYPVAAIYLVLAAPSSRAVVIGAVVAAFGLIVRTAASGHLKKDQELATSGLYSRTRNPLYLGSAFLAAGFIIAGRSWWAGSLVGIYFAVFYYAVMRNEGQDLSKRFGPAFDEYAARVPLFIPSFSGGGRVAATTFSWAQYRRNREYQALIGTIAGLGILFLRMWIRKRFGF